jgi:hypothetical protein
LISFNNEIQSPRDAASGQASGKRQHKPFNFMVSSTDNSVVEVKNQPFKVTEGFSDKYKLSAVVVHFRKGLESTTVKVENGEFTFPPAVNDGDYDLIMSWSWGASQGGKRCDVSFKLTMKDGACIAIDETGVH